MSGIPPVLIPREFFQLAIEFYTAYRALPETPPPSWPRYFMLCHSVELALKAFLATRGKSTSQLKTEFGHNLQKSLEEAVRSGLALEPATLHGIGLLNEAHSKFWPRYPKEDATPVFAIDQFESNAFELIHQIGKVIYGSNYCVTV